MTQNSNDTLGEMTVAHNQLDSTLALLRQRGRLVLSVSPVRHGYKIRVAARQLNAITISGATAPGN
jgi:hypothetical protein